MTHAQNLTLNQITLYNTAYKLYRSGEYTEQEFIKFCKANNINVND